MSRGPAVQHLDHPLILRVTPVRPQDCQTPTDVSIVLNKLIDALNQLLPGHGSWSVTEDGHLMVRRAVPVTSGRDQAVDEYADLTANDTENDTARDLLDDRV